MGWIALPLLALELLAPGEPPVVAPVQLDVAVVDARGASVGALPAEAFRLVESDGLDLVDVRYVPAAPPPAGPTTPPRRLRTIEDEREATRRPGARVLALFLDEYHVSPGATAGVRDALARFIRERTRDGDLLLVVKPLDSLLELRFTTDRASVAAEVDAFEGRLGDYRPRSRLEAEMMAGDTARLDGLRAQVALSALQAITAHLTRLPDVRKALLVVSEGFDVPASRRGGVPIPTADAIGRLANRHTVAIYALDPRPAGAAADPAGEETPFVGPLAADTGGAVLRGPLSEGFERVGRDMDGYYLLTVRAPADGRFHPLRVALARPGLTARGRPGFWAVSAEEAAAARRLTTPPAPRPLPAPVRTSRLILPWFGQARGEAGRTEVTIVWEPARTRSGLPPRALPPSRLQVTAKAEDGTPLFAGPLAPSVSEQAGPDARVRFSAPPGRVRLEMTIEDAAARVLDTDTRDLLVGRLAGSFAIGTPAVFRARTARAFAELVRRLDAAPTAARDFSRVERLLIRVPVYAASADPHVSAVLTNRAGRPMRDLPVERAPAPGLFAIDLPLASLAAGEYNVVVGVRAREEDVQDAVKETVSFRVTP